MLKKSKEFNLVFSKEQQFLLGQFIEYRERVGLRLKKLEGLETKMNDQELLVVEQANVLDAEYGI